MDNFILRFYMFKPACLLLHICHDVFILYSFTKARFSAVPYSTALCAVQKQKKVFFCVVFFFFFGGERDLGPYYIPA